MAPQRMDWLWAAILATAFYLHLLSWSIGWDAIFDFWSSPDKELNALGDFIAGAFAPIAVVWLVAAVLAQRQELDETREQFEDGQTVIRQQLQDAADQAVRNYKLSLFEPRIEIFNELENLAHNFYERSLGDFQDRVARLLEKSHFLFGRDVFEFLNELHDSSARLDELNKNINDLEDQVHRATSARKYGHPTNINLEASAKALDEEKMKRDKVGGAMKASMTRTERVQLFSKYLTVTDAAKESVFDAKSEASVNANVSIQTVG